MKTSQEVKDHFNSKFIYSHDVAEILTLGMKMNEHVVLYGKGGHGKSVMTEEFFKYNEIKPFVKSLGKGTTIEDLLGGIKIKEFQEEGKLEFNVENSFMNYEHVVLEEAFDVSMQVLEQFKDILTSGQFRNGTQIFEIKTKFIVICTNKTRHELSEDDSIKALLERFPYELLVEWPTYTAYDYSAMFKIVLGDSMGSFAIMVEEANKVNFISPRTAIKAALVYKDQGLQKLQYVAGFSKGIVEALQEKCEELQYLERERKKMANISDAVNKIISSCNAKINEKTRPILCMQAHNHIQKAIYRLKDISVTDQSVKEYNRLLTKLQEYANEYLDKAVQSTKNNNVDFENIELIPRR